MDACMCIRYEKENMRWKGRLQDIWEQEEYKRYSKYRQKRLTRKWLSQCLFTLIQNFQHYCTKITGAKRDYIYRKPCMYHMKSQK
jgi:hypothetical protein